MEVGVGVGWGEVRWAVLQLTNETFPPTRGSGSHRWSWSSSWSCPPARWRMGRSSPSCPSPEVPERSPLRVQTHHNEEVEYWNFWTTHINNAELEFKKTQQSFFFFSCLVFLLHKTKSQQEHRDPAGTAWLSVPHKERGWLSAQRKKQTWEVNKAMQDKAEAEIKTISHTNNSYPTKQEHTRIRLL